MRGVETGPVAARLPTVEDVEGEAPVRTARNDMAAGLEDSREFPSHGDAVVLVVFGDDGAVALDPHMGKHASAEDGVESLIFERQVQRVGHEEPGVCRASWPHASSVAAIDADTCEPHLVQVVYFDSGSAPYGEKARDPGVAPKQPPE